MGLFQESVLGAVIPSWDEYLMMFARMARVRSKDPSSKIGAVIATQDHRVITTGYNSFPSGVNDLDEDRWKRPEKYFWVVHAELNAIVQAARHGIAVNGCSLYTTGAPCMNGCAQAICQSGIREVVVDEELGTQWGRDTSTSFSSDEHVRRTKQLFQEVGVHLRFYKFQGLYLPSPVQCDSTLSQ